LSAALSNLSAFRDGFEEAGHGFGYTFPSRWPWMRIDRIFATSQFRFISFGVGRSQVSDHRPVYATLEHMH
jgi:endonuclease/exonuclease/phosphatase family metal-dependent hydrolase